MLIYSYISASHFLGFREEIKPLIFQQFTQLKNINILEILLRV